MRWKRRWGNPRNRSWSGSRRAGPRLTLETAQKLMRLIDLLEEDDDVQAVTHNFDVPEDVAAQL